MRNRFLGIGWLLGNLFLITSIQYPTWDMISMFRLIKPTQPCCFNIIHSETNLRKENQSKYICLNSPDVKILLQFMYFPKNQSSCHYSRIFLIHHRCSVGFLSPCLRAIFIAAPLGTSDNSGSDRCLGVVLKPLMGSFATLLTHFSLLPLLKDFLSDALQVLISFLPLFRS